MLIHEVCDPLKRNFHCLLEVFVLWLSHDINFLFERVYLEDTLSCGPAQLQLEIRWDDWLKLHDQLLLHL